MKPADQTEFLAIGQPIEVDVPLIGDAVDVYYSQIMDLEADRLLIALPQRQGQIASRLYPQQELTFRILLQDAFYTCASRVIAWQDDPAGLMLSYPEQVQRVQRRHYVRVDASLPVTLIVPDDDLRSVDISVADLIRHPQSPLNVQRVHQALTIESSTTDLSGGGMMLIADQAFELDTPCEGKLFLPPEKDPDGKFEVVPFQSLVCRCQPQGARYLIGLSFVDMPEFQRDKIIRYIFRYQRESIQNKPHLMI